MKINKQKFVQLMKEAYNKKLVTEDDETQGSTMEKPAADVTAVIKQVNARLQGRMEYSEASKAFLEYVLEFSEEGATKNELIKTCVSLLGEQGRQAAEYLTRMAKAYRKVKAEQGQGDNSSEPSGQMIKTSQGDQDLQSFMAEIKTDLESNVRTRSGLDNFINKIIGIMKINDQDARKAIGDSVYDLIADNSEKLPLGGTQNEDYFNMLVKRNIK